MQDSNHRRERRERKERVLHTRVSKQLSEDIRRMAEDLRVPVSNLVRNVLEEAFSVVEAVSENVGDLVEDVMEEADRARHRVRRRAHQRQRRVHRRRHGHGSGGGWTTEWREESASRFAEPGELDATPKVEPERPASEAAPGPEPADAADRDDARPPTPDDPRILGWQSLRLNRPAHCAECGKTIPRGREGHVAVGARGLLAVVLCDPCGAALA